jgi:RimJ/RimL family protein N-acetyltransferase
MDLSPVTLAGRHVRLEPLAEGHLDGLWAVADDPELWRFTVDAVRSRADLGRWFEQAERARLAGTALPFATVLASDGTVVGSTRFLNASPPDGRVEIGSTFVGAAWQRTAVNTEAKYLMLRHAFEAWGCVRVELKTGHRNLKSQAAILGLGARQEGTLRRHTRMHDGTWRDTVYFGVLEDEWPRVKAGLEARMARSR